MWPYRSSHVWRDVFCEVVFVDEVLRDVGKLDAAILWALEGGTEVEVFEVEAGKLGVASGQNAVDDELDKLERACGCANVARITDAVATNGVSCAMRVGFDGLHFAHHFGVSNLCAGRGGVSSQ